MKMKFVYIAVIVFGGLYLSGCQKESSVERGAVVPVVTNLVGDSDYLDKIYTIDSNIPTQDTSEIITLHYDNLKRVVSLNDSTLNPTEHFQSFYYYYNGTDTVPNRSVEITNEVGIISGPIDTFTTYFTYDNNKRKIKDSVIRALHSGVSYSIQKIITQYTNTSTNIYAHTVYQVPTINDILYNDTANLDAGGSIILNKRYEHNGTNYVLKATSLFNYDSHLNPFSRLSNFKAHQPMPTGETLFFEYMGKQNIQSQTENIVYPFLHTFNLTNVFTYNSHLYPKTVISYFSSDTIKVLYTYKTL